MSVHASYLVHSDEGGPRDPMDFNPEFSRRARSTGMTASGQAEILNDVVFNQVLVRWLAGDGDHDAFNERVIDRIQRDGTAFFSGTTWNGVRLLRISVSDWATDEDDVDRSVDAPLKCAAEG